MSFENHASQTQVRGMKTLASIVFAVTATFTLIQAAGTEAHKVNVTMTEYKFDMPASVQAGKTEFLVKNDGKSVHTFAIKGNGVNQKISPNPKPGESATLTVDLKPGTYQVTCPVDFHTAKGMKATLTVK